MRNWTLISLFTALSLFVGGNALGAPRVPHVFIISIDGGKPDVIRKSQMPMLLGLVTQAAATWKARTVEPNVTLPSHTSMLTGVSPKRHKITWNSWEPSKGLVRVQTIFAKAKAAGLKTALFAAKEKFRHLNVPETLDVFALPAGSPGVSQEAAKYIIETKPNLAFMHLPEADSTGHKYGWGSSKQKSALRTVDAAIATIVEAVHQAGIAEQSVVIVTADHGGIGLSHGLPIAANYTIPWIAHGAGVVRGKALPSGIRTIDTAATALWLLDLPTAGIEGRPVTSAFSFEN
ncbi:MAG TPA: ectonucleotide pyrophosphatase/phosphodiesterase [Bdellovibrionales bacterium]|nr:ectonucleotide pyrophosphatase/phosphodiesterase [Bdellovibrionales bacterium]